MGNSWLEPEEWCMGALVGAAFAGVLGWWTFVSIPVCGFLWRCGGVVGGNKLFRRIGVPVTLSALLCVSHGMAFIWAALPTVLAIAVMSMGYGIPDSQDKGSWFGRLWMRIIGIDNVADAAVRATVGLLIGLAYFPLAFEHLLSWLIGLVVLVVGMPLIEELVP